MFTRKIKFLMILVVSFVYFNSNLISYSSQKNNNYESYKIVYSDCKENFLSDSKIGEAILGVAHPTGKYYSSYSYYDSSYEGYVIKITYRSSFTDELLNMKLLIVYSYGIFSIKKILSEDGWIPAFTGFNTIVDVVMSDMEKEYQNTSDEKKSAIMGNLIKLWKNGNLSGAVYTSGLMSSKYLDYSCY